MAKDGESMNVEKESGNDVITAKQIEEKLDEAQKANEISDKYVLLTVMLASVLFFGGISGTIESRLLWPSLLVIALISFLVTVSILGTMPICRE